MIVNPQLLTMASPKVLIIEHDTALRTELREMLPKGNYDVLEAENGERGISLISKARSQIRFMLLSLELPGLSGWAVLQYLQGDSELQQIPLVLMTEEATATLPALHRAIEIINKPFTKQQLQTVIKSVIQQAKLSQASLRVSAETPENSSALPRTTFDEEDFEQGPADPNEPPFSIIPDLPEEIEVNLDDIFEQYIDPVTNTQAITTPRESSPVLEKLSAIELREEEQGMLEYETSEASILDTFAIDDFEFTENPEIEPFSTYWEDSLDSEPIPSLKPNPSLEPLIATPSNEAEFSQEEALETLDNVDPLLSLPTIEEISLNPTADFFEQTIAFNPPPEPADFFAPTEVLQPPLELIENNAPSLEDFLNTPPPSFPETTFTPLEPEKPLESEEEEYTFAEDKKPVKLAKFEPNEPESKSLFAFAGVEDDESIETESEYTISEDKKPLKLAKFEPEEPESKSLFAFAGVEDESLEMESEYTISEDKKPPKLAKFEPKEPESKSLFAFAGVGDEPDEPKVTKETEEIPLPSESLAPEYQENLPEVNLVFEDSIDEDRSELKLGKITAKLEQEQIQSTTLSEGSVTLGGMDDILMRYNSTIVAEKIGALKDAMEQGEPGYRLVIRALKEDSPEVQEAAENILVDRLKQPAFLPLATDVNEWTNIKCLHILGGHSYWVQSLAIHPEGRMVVSGSKDSTIKVWDLKTGREVLNISGHTSAVLSVAVSPDGESIISSSTDNTIKIWNFQTGEEIKTISGDAHKIYVVAVSPDGKTIISASADNIVKPKFEMTLESVLSRLNPKNSSPILSIIGLFQRAKAIKIWDFKTGKSKGNFVGYSRGVTDLSIAPKGEMMVSGCRDHTLKVWDLRSRRSKNTLLGHTDEIRAVEIAPDGQTIISGSRDRTIKIWDLRTGHVLRTLRGHSQSVTCLCLSPDGQTIISGSRDSTVKIWDLQTGQQIHTLLGHTDLIRSVAITPDGKTLVTGSRDNTIRVWGKVIR